MSETRIWLVRHGKGRSFWDTYEEARQQQHSAERVGEETELIELAPAARIASLERQLEDTKRENDTLRGLLGNSAKPCPYCGLPAERQAECPSGFPGCSRADDMMLSHHFAEGYRADTMSRQMKAMDLQLSRVLHEMAGAVSLCWDPNPSGVFDATKAAGFVEAAIKELRSIRDEA